jgi:DnaJ-class molecular chaperone
MEIFGLEVGSSQSKQYIKKVYRARSLTLHPDMGGDADEFRELTDAFRVLEKVFKDNVERGDDSDIEVSPGKRLSELGKGYPITDSARTCDRCEGKGYNVFSGQRRGTGEFKKCPTCGGDGLLWYPCKRCGGTGRYVHPKAKKDVGECHMCKGSGKFYPYAKRRAGRGYIFYDFMSAHFWNEAPYIPGTNKRGQACKECSGNGEVEILTNGRPYYTICAECDGIGEIKMWNPVIPRGYLK